MRISLATSSEFVGRVHPDDALLSAELSRRGHRVSQLEWGDAVESDAVLIRTTWDYYRHLDEFILWVYEVEARAPMLNAAEVIEWNCNKFYLEDLRDAGVRIPDTVFVRNAHDVEAWLPSGERWVVKPDVSANSWETLATDDPEVVRAQASRLLKLGRRALIQPYLPAIESGEYSLVFFDGEYSHCVLKTPAPGDFRVQDDHGGTVALADPPTRLMYVALEAIEAIPFGALPYARCDLVETSKGPAVMELELIEPELFTRFADGSEVRFVDAIEKYLETS